MTSNVSYYASMAMACISLFGVIINAKNHLELKKNISEIASDTLKIREEIFPMSDLDLIHEKFDLYDKKTTTNATNAFNLTEKGIKYALCGIASSTLSITISTVALFSLHFFGLFILSCHLIISSCFIALYGHQILAKIKKIPPKELIHILYKKDIQNFISNKITNMKTLTLHKSTSAPILEPPPKPPNSFDS